jgi:hypothetical protein
VFGEDLADLPTDGLVDLEARLHEDQVGTLPLRGDRGHRRADSELACFVARRGDDAALGRSAHRDRLAAQIRIVALLDRRCVHVDVDDLAMRRRAGRHRSIIQ